MPRGKTPSLIGGSLGRPKQAVAKKLCRCSRCKEEILQHQRCYDIPQPGKPFSATRRFCSQCLALVLTQTRQDLQTLEEQVQRAPTDAP